MTEQQPEGATHSTSRTITMDRDTDERDTQERDTALFEAVQQLAAVGGWEYDVRTETLYTTSEVDRIYGREPQETVTLATIIERFHPSDRPAVRTALDTAIESGESFEGEWRLRPPGGDQRWVRVYGEPERETGSVVRIRGAIEEITAEKQHKERLNSLFETNRELLKQDSPEAVAGVAVDAAREVLGLSVNGIHLHDPDANALVPTASTEAATDLFDELPTFEPGEAVAWDAFETGEARIYDDVRTADERYNPDTDVRSELNLPLGDHGVFIAGSPQPDAFGDRTVSLAKILAANVETALDQLDRQQRLRRQNERLEEFTSIVSHDLRNPLSVAKAGVEVAKTEGVDGDSLDRVERAHDRMAALIGDLLSLARSGRDIETGDMETVALGIAANHAWKSVETGDADLETERDGEFIADLSRLQQLLENLFRNSVEHSSTSSRPAADDSEEHSDDPITIRVGTFADGFYVADDGPGIPESDREDVFEAGYTTHDDGTGLGLRIVDTVADAHGWDVTITESDTGGARFEITGVES